MSDAPKFEATSLVNALRDQIAIGSLLVLLVGIVSTDRYYSTFGIRYQLIDFPIQHIFYRGLTSLTEDWRLWIVYGVSVGWMYLASNWFDGLGPKLRRTAHGATYVVILVVVIFAFGIGAVAGRRGALTDMNERTSKLPTVEDIRGAGALAPLRGYRILLDTRDEFVLVRPTSGLGSAPYTHIVRKSAVDELVISR
jgi:hypothetical protein